MNTHLMLPKAVVSYTKSATLDGRDGSPCTSLPTCALLTGVNLPDHDDLFSMLSDDLRNQVTPHVASLRASGSTLGTTVGTALTQRNLIQSIVSQLMMGKAEVDDEEDEDDDEVLEVKRSNRVLPVLKAWYENQYPSEVNVMASPRKKSMKEFSRPPLIIVLEDFEGFPGSLLKDFILNLT